MISSTHGDCCHSTSSLKQIPAVPKSAEAPGSLTSSLNVSESRIRAQSLDTRSSANDRGYDSVKPPLQPQPQPQSQPSPPPQAPASATPSKIDALKATLEEKKKRSEELERELSALNTLKGEKEASVLASRAQIPEYSKTLESSLKEKASLQLLVCF